VSGLRQADLESALAVVGRINEIPTLDVFPARVLSLLRGLVGADIASYTEVDEAQLRLMAAAKMMPVDGPSGDLSKWTFDPPDLLPPVMISDMASDVHQHPVIAYFARTGDGRALRVSDFLSLREFQRLDIYQQNFRPLGARYQMAAALAVPGPVPAGIGFMRTTSDFTQRERDLLDLVRPHVIVARENGRTRADAQARAELLEEGLEAHGHAIALVRDGRVVPVSREADRMLHRWLPGGSVPAGLNGRPLVLEHDGARLTLRRAAGDAAMLLLDETRTAPDPARVRELGLTAREGEILALAAAGLSDAAVAERLVVSVRTVEKHLENAYRKLGVTDRRQAVATVLGPSALA
jgi:DNA-binding CsgD family transcriptional regulator